MLFHCPNTVDKVLMLHLPFGFLDILRFQIDLLTVLLLDGRRCGRRSHRHTIII
jgi:hypothetical protein